MESLIIVVAAIGGLIGLFIVFRQVNLWYFRINEIVDLLKEQNKSLQQIAFYLSGEEIRKSKQKE